MSLPVDLAWGPDGLMPAVVQEAETGEVLMLAWMDRGALAATLATGAVLGLIQVMQNLSDIEKVGHGIATAFVATIYGVAIANIIALPCGGKMKIRTRDHVQTLTLMLEGALGIQQGVNPMVLRERLEGIVPHEGSDAKGKDGAPAGASPKSAAA